MKKQITLAIVCLALALPLSAQKKEAERLVDSAAVVQGAPTGDLPRTILNQAACILVFPNVRKVAIGIGGSYGRGMLVCRNGATRKGPWGAPAIYSLDQGSVGVQLGSSSTDFVIVIMSQKGVGQILNGKTKLGSDAAAAAGPTGAEATSYNADTMKTDVLTYSRSNGLFAGVSLTGAAIDPDNDANKAIYGKEISAKHIVSVGAPIVPPAKPLVDLLNQASPSRK